VYIRNVKYMAESAGPGQPHALRSGVEPAYLGTGDPSRDGGGTVYSNEPRFMQAQYENIFGPAVRDIKWDEQRHKRHQRWHLPDALKGSNSFLTDRVDGLITDATSSPFTRNILPYTYLENPDRKIKWNVYSFDEGMASRVPYESAARVLPQSKRSFAGYAVRQGLAIAMEHNFMMSPQGMDNFRKQLMQLVGSIQLTNDLDVHMALLYAPSYQKYMDEKYYDTQKTIAQNTRMYVDLFGFVQKNENALDYLIEDAKNHLQKWGSKPPTFMLCNGALTRQLTMTPERTNYITNGPDGKTKLAQGPDLPSYRGLQIINTRQFSLESGTAPRDMLRRRVRVCEHYWIPWENANVLKRFEFYDQSRDSMFYLSFKDLWNKAFPVDSESLKAMLTGNTNSSGYDFSKLPEELSEELFKVFHQDELYVAILLGFWNENQKMFSGKKAEYVREFSDNGVSQVATFGFPQDTREEFLLSQIFLKMFIRQNFEHLIAVPSNYEENWSEEFQTLVRGLFQEFNEIVEFFTTDKNIPNDHNEASHTAQRFKIYFNHGDQKDIRNKLTVAYQKHKQIIEDIIAIVMSSAEKTGPSLVPFLCRLRAWGTQVDEIKSMLNSCFEKFITEQQEDDKYDPGDGNGRKLDINALNLSKFSWKSEKWKFLSHMPNFVETDKVRFMAIDLLLLRPCIEHYMLAVIMGRGGGPDELGATFWGQTELSCYDDSQHGIWGMSYKYHERAIVLNERNLIRVFDVCFDGYCGGNDSHILLWQQEDVKSFKDRLTNLTEQFNGPSFVVMGLPTRQSGQIFPNPLVLQTGQLHAAALGSCCPDRSLPANDIQKYQYFRLPQDNHEPSNIQAQIYDKYLRFAGLHELANNSDPGHAAYSNETCKPNFSFGGHMASILNGHREETQGSGHLGANFVGVASVREGRGMMPKGLPTLAHLV
jgi:hypothetical protein